MCLFWSRKTCTVQICCCINHLSDKIICLCSRKSSSLGNYEDWESGVGTKSKSIMLLQVDGVLSNGFISTPVLSTLAPDSPSESRSLEQTVSYPSLGREAVGHPPSPLPLLAVGPGGCLLVSTKLPPEQRTVANGLHRLHGSTLPSQVRSLQITNSCGGRGCFSYHVPCHSIVY